MPYIPNTDDDRQAMLAAIGVERFEDLLAGIPAALRLSQPLELPEPLAEPALSRLLAESACGNRTVAPQDCYLGGGAYVTHIPEAVRTLALRSEFITAYTPYQAEVSQGTLQTIFEFQTMIARLAGLDLANASLYDGATALVEGIRMAVAAGRKRPRVLMAGQILPRWREVVKTYFHPLRDQIELEWLPATGPLLDIGALRARLGEDLAAVVIQSPNAFGAIEDVTAAAELAHSCGALLVQAFDPLAAALFASPGECGADIAVAEGQSIAQPLQFGGPYIGLFAARGSLLKLMPGRLIGETLDAVGERGFVLAFQTREQHIRREKATSNICTNQALVATFATIHLALLGETGLREKAEALYTRASWLRERLCALPGVEALHGGEHFREIALRVPNRDEVLAALRQRWILGGLPLPAGLAEEGLLLAVNEYQERADLERFVQAFAAALEGRA
jgi:glycine dehydrogenase subunit 1